MTRRLFQSAFIVLALCLSALHADALPNLFVPVAGSSFQPSNFPHDTPDDAICAMGLMYNFTPAGGTHGFVNASLGHNGGGGTFAFHLYGLGNGATFSCTVFALNDITDFKLLPFTSSTTQLGSFSLTFNAAVPAGNWFYSVECTIPPENSNGAASIIGIRPDT